MFCVLLSCANDSQAIDSILLLQCSPSLEILPDFPCIFVVESVDPLVVPLVVFVDVGDLCIWVLLALSRALLSLHLPGIEM
jgi:hypothetical protein